MEKREVKKVRWRKGRFRRYSQVEQKYAVKGIKEEFWEKIERE